MGMFDMLNLRINGYDFHISLMGGKESWTDDRVVDVFTHWSEITDYYQPDVAGRTWQDAATAFGNKEVGMYLLGTFVTSNFDGATQQDIIDDITFFPFPEINAEHGQDAVEAPIDGFMMAASPENEEGAKALLTALGGAATIDAFIDVDPSSSPPPRRRRPTGTTRSQQKSAELVGSAKFIAQFLDRDTEPDFASQVVGKAIADYLAGQEVDGILATVEEQKQTYTFE